MSTVTTLYDAIQARIVALLPTHNLLNNPYKPEESNELYLAQGYGIKLGPGLNTNRQICDQVSIQRQFTVVLSRQFYAVEDDQGAKATTEKALLEDAKTLVNDFEKDTTVNGTAVRTLFISDTGINYVFNAKDQYLMTEVIFSAEYFEQII